MLHIHLNGKCEQTTTTDPGKKQLWRNTLHLKKNSYSYPYKRAKLIIKRGGLSISKRSTKNKKKIVNHFTGILIIFSFLLTLTNIKREPNYQMSKKLWEFEEYKNIENHS
jgi:hypothetical protein